MINIFVPHRGYTGINDGLSITHIAGSLNKRNGQKAATDFLKATWWWRTQSAIKQTRHLTYNWDREFLCFAYEAVARLWGQYPYAPLRFCDLDEPRVEVFAELFEVRIDYRNLPPIIEQTHKVSSRFISKSPRNKGVLSEEKAYRLDWLRAYSPPIQFNRLYPKEDLLEALNQFLEKEAAGFKVVKGELSKNGANLEFESLESWDWRRWKEDLNGNPEKWNKLEGMTAQLPGGTVPTINNSAVSRARRLALNATCRAQAKVTALRKRKRLASFERDLVELVRSIRLEKRQQ